LVYGLVLSGCTGLLTSLTFNFEWIKRDEGGDEEAFSDRNNPRKA
jgi:hypothetical protein